MIKSSLIGLHWPSVKARFLIWKLTYIPGYIIGRDDGLSSQVFRTLASDVYGIEQCRSLELHIGTGYQQQCLENSTDAPSIVHAAKDDHLGRCTLQDSRSHPSLAVVSVTDGIAYGMNALEYEFGGTRLMQGPLWSS